MSRHPLPSDPAPAGPGPTESARGALTATYWLATVLLHEPVQMGLAAAAARWGSFVVDLGAWLVILGFGAPLLGMSAWTATRRDGPAAGLAWVGWTAAAVAAWAYAGQTPAEGVHYLQYAALVGLLRAGGVGPLRAVAFGALLGAADEAFQGFVLYPGRGLDRPDIGFDGLGCALGALAWRTWVRPRGIR